jgi:hypothetical protein
MNNQQLQQKKQLLRAYHTLCSVNGLSESEKEALKLSFGAESSAQMSIEDLRQAIAFLNAEPDRWRKRVMAAIGEYLRHINGPQGPEVIKATACRAAGYDEFNRIPVSRLRAVYNEFKNTNRTMNLADNERIRLTNEIAGRN